MRIWHYKLISYLPDKQLLGQWRELNSIFKKQNKHILINYVYEYSKDDLFTYTILIINEMSKRNIKIKSTDNYKNYFKDEMLYKFEPNPFKNHHTDRYLIQCFYNLQEKYDRGQKDFTKEIYVRLSHFIRNLNILGGIEL